MSINKYPDFDNLPLDKQGSCGNAWELWGEDDQLGTLNLLTNDVVSRTAKEKILPGDRISLNWSMTGASYLRFVRKLLQQSLINKAPLKHAHDDEWTFSSQCSSQWDGFRHYAYQHKRLYYMGRKAEDFAASTEPNGIQHVAAKGIAGRTVLIDWYAWAQSRGFEVDAMTSYQIPFEQLVETLKHQGMSLDDFRAGDILAIRSGYIHQYLNMSDGKRRHLDDLYQKQKPDNIGVKPSKELLEFFWNKKLAAVFGDSRSFEVWPCTETEWHLHEWLLAGWGMPIGGLFDLESLSEKCQTTRRYTFFLSSSPMNACQQIVFLTIIAQPVIADVDGFVKGCRRCC